LLNGFLLSHNSEPNWLRIFWIGHLRSGRNVDEVAVFGHQEETITQPGTQIQVLLVLPSSKAPDIRIVLFRECGASPALSDVELVAQLLKLYPIALSFASTFTTVPSGFPTRISDHSGSTQVPTGNSTVATCGAPAFNVPTIPEIIDLFSAAGRPVPALVEYLSLLIVTLFAIISFPSL